MNRSSLYLAISAGALALALATNAQAATTRGIETVVPAAVPEPASWALMLIGFGGIGAMLRRHRRAVVTAR